MKLKKRKELCNQNTSAQKGIPVAPRGAITTDRSGCILGVEKRDRGTSGAQGGKTPSFS